MFNFHRLATISTVLAAAVPLIAADAASASGIDLKAMDTSVSPCQNFYQYACGTWRKDNPIPADRARWSRFDELQERNLAIERDILEKAAVKSAKRSAIDQQIGDFYASCMDESAIEAKGVQPINPLLDRIATLPSKQELAKEVVRLHQENVRVFFNFFVRPDPKNASINIASVDQGGLGLPDRDYYTRSDPKSVAIREKYEQYIANMFNLLAQSETQPALKNSAYSSEKNTPDSATVHAVMKIETELAHASLDRVARRNPDNTYHKMTVAELAALTPDFGWKYYIDNIGVAPVQTLNVGAPDFMKALNTVIENNSLADLKAYLTWHVLRANADLLTAAFRKEDFAFNNHDLLGVKEMPARWKTCVRATDRNLGEALGQKFVEVAFAGSSKAKALQLVGEIEHEMQRDIRSADWMSAATKDQALTKLQEVSNKIGYPEKWRDYSKVNVVRGEWFGDVTRAREFERERNLAKLGQPVDKSEWGMTPPTVNAYYNPPENNINFPAGILQPPFYNPKSDDAVNYGAIGVVIGHELTHGFDDQGRRYDGAGNLRDWWTPADASAFKIRADCVVDEYSGFTPVDGVHLNGRLTLGENAADNGGIHLAYMALMDSLANHVLPAKEDGFTPAQRFFLGYAQIWCENTTPESARAQAMTNPHSPGEFRVNGVLQNLPEFEQAYSCKLGDPMVSAKPCRVW